MSERLEEAIKRMEAKHSAKHVTVRGYMELCYEATRAAVKDLADEVTTAPSSPESPHE